MLVPGELQFHDDGPFDDEARSTIQDVLAAISATDEDWELVDNVERNVSLLDRLGALLAEFPSLFATHYLGKRQRDLSSLIDMLTKTNLSNFEMFLPTRALIGRTLVMAEMNFYRLLRFACDEALGRDKVRGMLARIDRHLCRCIYTRLAGELLTNIASDDRVPRKQREKAVLALLHIWDRGVRRVDDFLSVLQATWDARQRVRVAGGTLVGTTELFQLLQAGCDERFVDLLARPNRKGSLEESAAFREFLFGATTEQLEELEGHLAGTGLRRASLDVLNPLAQRPGTDPDDAPLGDPALALFEFFLSRHLQASARRQANLPGPTRTAEEYVMLHFLEAKKVQLLRTSLG